ncbi:MAG: ADP-ribosylglycohydrolase family protein [Promethearchaeota archaeon]
MKEISLNEYYNKVHGSWLGRVIGDFVGGPVEFLPYSYIKKKYGDLNYYPKEVDLSKVNDDEMYEICALLAFEKHGIDLTANDIAKAWIQYLYKDMYTAEKRAFKNLKAGIFPPESGKVNNIFYDAIGAQMRADIFGQIAPGCPRIAMNYAKMDGTISHDGIGIEGEIFVAILVSQAFFENDIRHNIESALNIISEERETLYSRMIRKSIEIFDKHPEDFHEGRKELIKFWHRIRRRELVRKEKQLSERRVKFLNRIISGVHVLPNAGIIVLSLLYGAKDKVDPLGRSVCISAMMGLDTDCNCGNVGAILGAQLGADKIPKKWVKPLKNTFNTYIKGHEHWKIDELAQRVVNIGKKVIIKKCSNVIKLKE